MGFSRGVQHAEGLNVRGKEPFNAETPLATLVEFEITPEELVYCRNHSPVIELLEDEYVLKVDGLVANTLSLKVKDLKEDFAHNKVVAALQCAGNRREEMAQIKPVRGILWRSGVIANCSWGGVRLRDILLRAGIDISMHNGHVWFSSYVAPCQDDSYYGGSIPLSKALDPDEDVLIAFEMNGRRLSPDHGYPLRAVVPGYTGARWVKWVDRITVAKDESPNYYQQLDYRILPPDCETQQQAAPLWCKYPSIGPLAVNSVIASVNPILGASGRLYVKGYAMGNGGKGKQIEKIQVMVRVEGQAEENWTNAIITYQEGKWSWTLWECELDVNEAKAVIEEMDKKRELKLFSRARDQSGVEQQRECAWNLRGVAYNAYGNAIWHW